MASPLAHLFPPLRAQNCGNCRYARARAPVDDIPAQTTCRRSSPQSLVVDGTVYSMWPVVIAEDWCGDWVCASSE